MNKLIWQTGTAQLLAKEYMHVGHVAHMGHVAAAAACC
jgi:hypothetical protein